MEATYSISTLIKSNHVGEKTALVYVRVTVNGERAEISIKRSVERDRWDAAANRVRGNKEDAREINTLLDNTVLKLNKIYNKLLENGETITARRIKDIYLGKNETKKTLLEAFADHNQMMASRIGVDFSRSTYTRYSTTKDHVTAFLKHRYNLEDINLPHLQYAFVTDFEHFLKVVRKCNHNSTLKYIRNFRKIVNLSVKNDWLDRDPFKAYQVKLRDTKRTFLNREELARLEEKSIEIERLDNVRDVFVFCCYTGLSYVDVEKLTKHQIVKGLDSEDWINVERTKTGSPSNIPILPKAKNLLLKYRNHPECLNTGRLLPVISNQKMNAYLKELATLCGVEKKLTFHAARHTFATTVTLSNGIPLETVSAMLGHKNFKTTQIYAKVVQEKISKDMKKLRDAL